jgi:integrase
MGEDEITQFLSALAVHGQVIASTENQALCALIFLYRCVLGQNFGWLEDVVRAKRPQRLPVVLTRPEIRALLGALDGVHWIMAGLLSRGGLRLLECLRLRVKDGAIVPASMSVTPGTPCSSCCVPGARGTRCRRRRPH